MDARKTLCGSAAMVAMLMPGPASAANVRATITRGTVIPVSLTQNLSSDRSHTGDSFTCKVESNYLGLPSGTKVHGVVDRAVPKSGDKPGTLSLRFTEILLPLGKAHRIEGSPIGLDSKSVHTESDGRMVAKNGSGNQRLTYVGYGAAGGAVLGIIGGGANLIKGAAIGAGLGYLGGSLTKSDKNKTNNVLLKSGTSVGVMMDKTVHLSW